MAVRLSSHELSSAVIELGADRRTAGENELPASRGRFDREPLHVDAMEDLLRQILRRGRWTGEPESLDSRLRGADLSVQPHFAMGGEARHIEEAHRQEDEPDCDRKDARGEAKAVQHESGGACVSLQRLARRGRFSAALALNCEVEHDFLKSLQDLSSSSI